MTTEATINGNTVFRDSDLGLTHRWYDAIGPDVCKMVEDFVDTPFSAGDQLAGWLNTEVDVGADDTTAILVAGSVGGELALKTAENESDGANVQLLGEAFYLADKYPTYIGARFRSSDADQTEITLGLCITDTTLAGGMSDGLYFRVLDTYPTLELVAEKDSLETVVAVGTVLDGTYITAEMLYLNGVVTAYVNGVQVATIADSDVNFPDDEYLTPSMACIAGAAVVGGKTLTVDWFRCIQIQTV